MFATRDLHTVVPRLLEISVKGRHLSVAETFGERPENSEEQSYHPLQKNRNWHVATALRTLQLKFAFEAIKAKTVVRGELFFQPQCSLCAFCPKKIQTRPEGHSMRHTFSNPSPWNVASPLQIIRAAHLR